MSGMNYIKNALIIYFILLNINVLKVIPMQISWSRGLWRLWLVGSILWVGFVAVILRPDQAISTYWDFRNVNFLLSVREVVALSDNPFDQAFGTAGHSPLSPEERRNLDLRMEAKRRFTDAKAKLQGFGLFGFIPPILIFSIGISLIWAARGFNSR
jgi:hypothetical protein